MTHLNHEQLQNLGINISVIIIFAYLVIWVYRQFKRHNYWLSGQMLSVIAGMGFVALVFISILHPQAFPITLLVFLFMIEHDRRITRSVEVVSDEKWGRMTLIPRGVAKKASPNEKDKLVSEPELE